jgi:hypothetical protein
MFQGAQHAPCTFVTGDAAINCVRVRAVLRADDLRRMIHQRLIGDPIFFIHIIHQGQ